MTTAQIVDALVASVARVNSHQDCCDSTCCATCDRLEREYTDARQAVIDAITNQPDTGETRKAP